MEDDRISRMLGDFCANHREELVARSIRRITFLALNKYVSRCRKYDFDC